MTDPEPTWPERAGRTVKRRVIDPLVDRRDWFAAHAIVLVLLVIGIGIALICGAFAGEVYDAVADGEAKSRVDRPVLEAAQRWRTPELNDLVTGFTDLGGPVIFPVVVVGSLSAIAVRLHSWEPIVLGAIALPVALAMSMVGKAAVGRLRPPESAAVPPYETSASFPSGHTLSTTTLMALLAYLALRHLRRRALRAIAVLACGIYALAMGLSRVYLGHHWVTDVAAAWFLAVGWVITLVVLHQTFLLVRAHPPRRSGHAPTA